jgi:hypothetical protein
VNNPRITIKERELLVSAIRRVFSRSELRREVLESVRVVSHVDPAHPRVKHWSRCPLCKKVRPRYLFAVDHISPIVPVTTTLKKLLSRISINELLDIVFCDRSNLQPICKTCHNEKTNNERRQRRCLKVAA